MFQKIKKVHFWFYNPLVFDLSMDILINDIECQEVDLKMNEETIEPMEHQAKVEICFTLKIGLYNLSETLVEVNQAIIAWSFRQ